MTRPVSPVSVAGLAALLVAALGLALLSVAPPAQARSVMARSVMAGSVSPAAAAAPCFRPSNGLDTCRDYLGASVGDDPTAAADETSQFALHEARYGAQRIFHSYAGHACHLTQSQVTAAGRTGGYLFLNWRVVADDWSTATGGDATVNACITTMADDIRALGRPIFLAVWHEAGDSADRQALADAGCSYTVDADGNHVYPSSGTSGTAADYRAMWTNVQRIFAAEGTTNVYWAYVMLTDTHHLCMVNPLYPTGSKVDWIGLDQYGAPNVPSYAANATRIVSWLDANSILAHPYNRRPWALAEWGWQDDGTVVSPAQKAAYFDAAAQSVRARSFPGIHMYLVFDNLGGGQVDDTRVAYFHGAFCAQCRNRYAAFAATVRDTVH